MLEAVALYAGIFARIILIVALFFYAVNYRIGGG